MNSPASLAKVTWDDVRKQVKACDADLASLIDAFAPSVRAPLYLATYPYADAILREGQWQIPQDNGKVVDLARHALATEVQKNTQYTAKQLPLALMLSGSAELYISHAARPLPYRLLHPGDWLDIDAFAHTVPQTFMPQELLQMSAGARSLFFIPYISDVYNHKRLQREFTFRIPPPKTLAEQWSLFKTMLNHEQSACTWQAQLLVFSDAWIQALRKKAEGLAVIQYIQEQAWLRTLYHRQRAIVHQAVAEVQQQKLLSADAFLVEMAKHLLSMVAGSGLGFSVAQDDSLAPVAQLQSIYRDIYGLQKYAPTIMVPSYYQGSPPAYYSMQYPIQWSYPPRARKAVHTQQDLRQLAGLMQAVVQTLTAAESPFIETVMGQRLSHTLFEFFHSKHDSQGDLQLSDCMPAGDSALSNQAKNHQDFAKAGAFVRGCVRIRDI